MVSSLSVTDLTIIGSFLAALLTIISGVYAIRLRPQQEHREDTKLDLEENKVDIEKEKVTAERFQKLWDRVDALEKRNTELWNENQSLRRDSKERDAQHQAEIHEKEHQVVLVLSERDAARRERDEALAQVGPLKEQVERLQSEVEQLRAEVNGNGKDGH